jgi:thiamine biosynthesis lipoprotein
MENKLYKSSMRLMGNQFQISLIAANAEQADAQTALAVAEISRIEKLLTTFADDSQTNRINANAGIAPVKVDAEVFALIQRAQRISGLTQGAFDLSYGSLDKRFWNFDTEMKQLPDAETAKKMVQLINYQNILLDENEQSVFLVQKGMRIGFGGIGKGYAAERAKLVLQQNGVKSGIINASGDLAAWGAQPNGQAWTVGIAAPEQANRVFAQFNISNMAVATSGNYEKFVIIAGRKYSHTINPKTGFPVSGIKSCTIIAPNAELADALTTPIMVMGKDVGLHLIDQMKQIACVIIDDNDRIFTSKNININ